MQYWEKRLMVFFFVLELLQRFMIKSEGLAACLYVFLPAAVSWSVPKVYRHSLQGKKIFPILHHTFRLDLAHFSVPNRVVDPIRANVTVFRWTPSGLRWTLPSAPILFTKQKKTTKKTSTNFIDFLRATLDDDVKKIFTQNPSIPFPAGRTRWREWLPRPTAWILSRKSAQSTVRGAHWKQKRKALGGGMRKSVCNRKINEGGNKVRN